MIFSKNIFTGILLAITTVAVVGCSVDSKKGKSAAPGDSVDFPMDDGTNFRVDTWTVSSSSVVAWQSNGQYPAQKLFNYSACLKDFAGNSMNPDMSFEVSDSAGNSRPLKTLKNGCLIWSEAYEINGLDNESIFVIKRTITAQNTYRGRVYAKGGLNPWLDSGASFIDFRTTVVPARYKIVDNDNLVMKGFKFQSSANGPQIYIDSINFQFLGLDYSKFETNRFLGLTIAQLYRVRMRPQVIRQTINNEIDLKTINKGRMKVVVTLLKDLQGGTLDPKNVITSLEFIGDIILGTLTADITLKIDSASIPSMLSRSQVVVTLIPMDELSDFVESTFQGPSNAGLLASTTLIPSAGNARLLGLASAEAALKVNAAREAVTPMQLFTKFSAAQPLEASGTVRLGTAWSALLGAGSKPIAVTEALEKLLSGQLKDSEVQNLQQYFCHKFYGNSLKSDNCADTQVDRVFFMSPREMVESVDNKVVWMGETTKETLSLRTRVDYSRSEGWNQALRWGFSGELKGEVSGGWNLNLKDLIGGGKAASPIALAGKDGPLTSSLGASARGSAGARVSAGMDWYKMSARNSSTTVSDESSRNIDVIGNSFEILAKVRSCVLLGPKPTGKEDEDSDALKTFFYCSKNVRAVKKTESFYLLNEKIGDDSTGFSDSGSPLATPWRMFVRGPKTYLLFKNMIESLKTRDLVLEKLPTNGTISDTMKLFPEFYMMQDYPGMFTP
jgi:hypothetical protein